MTSQAMLRMTISSRGPTLEPGMLSVRMGGKTADTVPPPPALQLPWGISSYSGWRSWPAWNCLSVSPFLAVADKYILLDKNTSTLTVRSTGWEFSQHPLQLGEPCPANSLAVAVVPGQHRGAGPSPSCHAPCRARDEEEAVTAPGEAAAWARQWGECTKHSSRQPRVQAAAPVRPRQKPRDQHRP